MRKLLPAIFTFAFISGYSQTNDGVAIIKDPRLDLLIKKQVELNRQVYLQNNRTGAGFRVLVVNTNDRAKAFEVKSKLMSRFPEHKTYLIYQSPYFKVQIGNFRDREEASSLRQKILSLYPTGVIVVPSTVELKPDLEDLAN
ncbi:SPOR domain-containing protein [Pollutibacter soli]|uniref:SPOR domain-containing protein n=1 Tax=Pollutibacter soli TaxID=3034157 RepID=UPI00301377D1